MAFERLPETVQTLYAELLDLSLRAEAEQAARGLLPGSFVSKEVKGSRYWYLQVSVGNARRQVYLGPDSEALRRWMDAIEKGRLETGADDQERRRLAAMLSRGGADREPAVVGRVLALLSRLGLFRAGAVVVGTHAFRAYGNLLGVRFPSQALRTQDIDIGYDSAIALALQPAARTSVAEAIAAMGLGFLPVPGLDPRHASTSFKIRGRELRVDFLTPARGRESEAPVPLRELGLAAQPLPFLEELIAGPVPAVVLAAEPVLVRVPEPARFALHKLWTAGSRPSSEQTRAAKDRRQAWAVMEVLLADRPGDLAPAWQSFARRPRLRKVVSEEIARGPADLVRELRRAGVGAAARESQTRRHG